MGFRGVYELASRENEGACHQSFFHKTGSPVLAASGMWGDLSQAPGTPRFNAYSGSPLEATQMVGVGNFGLYAGEAVPGGFSKHIAEVSVSSPGATFFPANFLLCDYLMFYPLVDMDSTDFQPLDNPVGLPRYATGEGVYATLVTSVAQTATGNVTMTYTNSAGTTGRTVTFSVGVANTGNVNVNGAVAGQRTIFVPLQAGDRGVQSVQSVQLNASCGGFATLVLVKPLAGPIIMREQNTVQETHLWKDRASLPKVENGACLNFFFLSGVAAASSVVRGHVTFVWGLNDG